MKTRSNGTVPADPLGPHEKIVSDYMEEPIILKKAGKAVSDMILRSANAIISKIPDICKKTIPSDYFDSSTELWLYEGKGFYEISFIDHGEVVVTFLGRDINETVNNRVQWQIELYLSLDYQLSHPDDLRPTNVLRKEFWEVNNCYVQLPAPSYETFVVRQINTSFFFNSIGIPMKEVYKKHSVFYGNLGYLYAINKTDEKVLLYKLGKDIREAEHCLKNHLSILGRIRHFICSFTNGWRT